MFFRLGTAVERDVSKPPREDTCGEECLLMPTPSTSVTAPPPLQPQTSLPPVSVYVRSHKVLLCAPPKSGSTSVYSWLFELSYDRSFGECVSELCARRVNCSNGRRPLVHDVGNGWCWNQPGRLQLVGPGPFGKGIPAKPWRPSLTHNEIAKLLQDRTVLRVMVARDPITRAISMWKSKAACDTGAFRTDISDRPRMLKQLFGAAGEIAILSLGFGNLSARCAMPYERGYVARVRAARETGEMFASHKCCLHFNEFVRLLALIGTRGSLPNDHFKPQAAGPHYANRRQIPPPPNHHPPPQIQPPPF